MSATTLTGGPDNFSGAGGVADNIDGAGGNDTLRGNDQNDTLFGNIGDDWLFGGSQDDSLLGGEGNDVLVEESGINFLDGGDGNDSLVGGGGSDTLVGGLGNDTLRAGGGDDSLSGGDGNDSLIGGTYGVETLDGGSGDDFLQAGGGPRVLFGGSGNDTFTGFTNDSETKFINGGGGDAERAIINANFDPTRLSLVPGTVSINGTSYAYQATYISGTGYNFYFAEFDGSLQFNDTVVDLDVVCFAAGTMIMTAAGERPVESLRAGDLVLTASNRGAPFKPVRWVGRREVDLDTHPRAAEVAPILVLPGALGAGVPHRPLRVSPEHALLVDGMLVPAGLLVDGETILRTPGQGRVTYLHVELDSHDLLLSEGAATESYLEMGNRHAFANAGILAMLHPDFAPRPGHANAALSCRPRVTGGPALEAARVHLSRIRRRAAQDDMPAPQRASA